MFSVGDPFCKEKPFSHFCSINYNEPNVPYLPTSFGGRQKNRKEKRKWEM